MANAKLYSNLCGSATILPNPTLEYPTLCASVAAAADADSLLLQVGDSSPCVLAFVDRKNP